MELEFSIMADTPHNIQPLLEQFEAETGIHVRLRLLAWDSAWSMFVRAALYSDGPDVSEIGTTWVGDLIGMNALRPYGAAEVAGLGRSGAYFPTNWKTAVRLIGPQPSTERVWGIPWLTGARLIFFRPDLLEKAGSDPQTAFQTGASLNAAVQRLNEHGVRVPWTVPTGTTHTTLLNVASWVWSAGGDFIRADGKATLFAEPPALQGLADYFTLARFFVPEICRLNGLEPDTYFLDHPDAAMTISGPWLFNTVQQKATGPVSVAIPPGGSFVGGSNLVIWKHTRHPEAAIELVRFLTEKKVQIAYSQRVGLLPARIEALQSAPFSTDPLWQVAVKGLQTGRTFPTIRLWGLVEDRLTAGLSAVWESVLNGMDPGTAVKAHLVPLADRLNLLLEKE